MFDISHEELTVVEGGACDFYSIRLKEKPLSDVMVQINELSKQVRISPKAMRFFADDARKGIESNWNVPQTVRVVAVDDDTKEMVEEMAMLEHVSKSNDKRFSTSIDGTYVKPIKINIVDNDGGFLYLFGDILENIDKIPVLHSLRKYHSDSRASCNKISGKASSSTTTLIEESIRSVSCGQHHIAVILADGRLLTMGSGKSGQLGHGDFESHRYFLPWSGIDASGVLRSRITQVACGYAHTALVTDDGRLLTFGSNDHGQLGLCSKHHVCTYCSDDSDVVCTSGADFIGSSAVPHVVMTFSKYFVEKVSCGAFHTVVLASSAAAGTGRGTSKCEMFVWGNNHNGAIGIAMSGNVFHPVLVQEISAFDPYQIGCGGNFSAVLCNKGDLYTTGWGIGGFYGRRSSEDDPMLMKFVHIKSPRTVAFVDVSCGTSHMGVMAHDGSIFVCGDNQFGQLGLGDTVRRTLLTQVAFFNHIKISSMAFGEFHSTCRCSNGDFYAWGCNVQSQLGLGSQMSDQHLPVLHTHITSEVVQVAAGASCTAVILRQPENPKAREFSVNKARLKKHRASVEAFLMCKEHERSQRLKTQPKNIRTASYTQSKRDNAHQVVQRKYFESFDFESLRKQFIPNQPPCSLVTNFKPMISEKGLRANSKFKNPPEKPEDGKSSFSPRHSRISSSKNFTASSKTYMQKAKRIENTDGITILSK